MKSKEKDRGGSSATGVEVVEVVRHSFGVSGVENGWQRKRVRGEKG